MNIYVPDIYDSGRDDSVKNITRCREIETAAQKWVEGLSGAEYLFSLARTIATFEEADIKQHFVSVRLKFQRWGFI